MAWVFVFGGIGLAGLVMLIAYAVWLAHKASDVMSELGVLADRGDQLAELLAQVSVPDLGTDEARLRRELNRSQSPTSSRRRRMGRRSQGSLVRKEEP